MHFRSSKHKGFTLVEIMVVVAIITLLAVIAVPGFIRSAKRSKASAIANDLRSIDSAVDQYALENNKTSGAPVAVSDWTRYLKTGTKLYLTGQDVLGNTYGDQTVHSLPRVPPASKTTLSDVADDAFWSPYQ